MKAFKPLIFFTAMILLTGLACNAIMGGGGDQQPASQDSTSSTDEPGSVVNSGAQYFTEDFDQDPGWNYQVSAGSGDLANVSFGDSRIKFDFEGTEIKTYYMYEGQSYDNVRIDLRAENRGRVNYKVSLVCRASEEGWYEFTTEGGGLWTLFAVGINEKNKPVYRRVNNGGTLALKQGKETNEFGLICNERSLTLIINGESFITVEETKYALREGYVGFGIASSNVTPIILEVDWFKVNRPE